MAVLEQLIPEQKCFALIWVFHGVSYTCLSETIGQSALADNSWCPGKGTYSQTKIDLRKVHTQKKNYSIHAYPGTVGKERS